MGVADGFQRKFSHGNVARIRVDHTFGMRDCHSLTDRNAHEWHLLNLWHQGAMQFIQRIV